MMYIPSHKTSTIRLKNANWDGNGIRSGDIALDMHAGGHGIKGETDPDGTVHSCAATILNTFAPQIAQEALKPFIAYIDAHDAFGRAVSYLFPEMELDEARQFGSIAFGSIVLAIRNQNEHRIHETVRTVIKIFNGIIEKYQSKALARIDAKKATILSEGRIALAMNLHHGVPSVLFAEGAQFVIFVNGYRMGIIRAHGNTCPTSHPRVQQYVRKCKEESEWFAHTSGFLYARGTKKVVVKSPSSVDPHKLAQVLDDALLDWLTAPPVEETEDDALFALTA